MERNKQKVQSSLDRLRCSASDFYSNSDLVKWRLLCLLSFNYFLHHAAVLCLVTQRSSPQTAAHIRTTFLSHCFCGLMKGPIMYQQIENDVSVRAKKDNGTSGRSFSYWFFITFFLVVDRKLESWKCFVGSSPSGSNERVFIFGNSRLILLK